MAKKMKFPVQEAAGIIAGSIAAGFVTKLVNDKLPNVPPVVKAFIPIGAGLFLAGQKNTIVKNAGLGMIAKGGTDLARAFMPGIGADIDNLLGDPADQSILSLPADQSVLSAADDFMGEIEGPDEFMGEEFVSADEFISADEFVSADDAMLMGNDEI